MFCPRRCKWQFIVQSVNPSKKVLKSSAFSLTKCDDVIHQECVKALLYFTSLKKCSVKQISPVVPCDVGANDFGQHIMNLCHVKSHAMIVMHVLKQIQDIHAILIQTALWVVFEPVSFCEKLNLMTMGVRQQRKH